LFLVPVVRFALLTERVALVVVCASGGNIFGKMMQGR